MTSQVWSVLLKFGPMVYGPTLLFAIGQGALLPMLPLIAAQMGASVAAAGAVAGIAVIGQVIGNLPAGALVAQFGERVTMICAGGLGAAALVGIVLAPNLYFLALFVFVLGSCASAFGLARHAFMTTRVPLRMRARALALLGGTFRFGGFAGPFIAAGLIFVMDTQLAPAYAFMVLISMSVLLVAFGPDPSNTQSSAPLSPPTKPEPVTARISVFSTIWEYRSVLSRLGSAAASMSAMRAAKQVILPIWGLTLGFDASTISLTLGVIGAIEFAMFYASGQIMDRFGRLWTSMPPMLLIGTALIGLSATQLLPEPTPAFILSAALIGLGSGLSSGTLLTIGSDLAPRDSPAPFLSAWRTVTDSGGAVAPLIFSGIAALAGIALATSAIGVVGLAGAAAFWRWMPRSQTSPSPRSQTEAEPPAKSDRS